MIARDVFLGGTNVNVYHWDVCMHPHSKLLLHVTRATANVVLKMRSDLRIFSHNPSIQNAA